MQTDLHRVVADNDNRTVRPIDPDILHRIFAEAEADERALDDAASGLWIPGALLGGLVFLGGLAFVVLA